MTPFERPLVALSLTEPDVELLQYAQVAVQHLGWRRVQFIHVLVSGGQPALSVDAARQRIAAEVAQHFLPGLTNCQAEYAVLEGARLDALIDHSVQSHCDVVLLGHRRERSGRRSLARRMAMLGPASVWMVPEQSPRSMESILVPTDLSSHSGDALTVASQVARAAAAKACRLLHVYFDPSTVRYQEHVDEVLECEQTALDAFVTQTNTEGIHWEAVLHESTKPAQAIIRVATDLQSDLIVMNTRGRSRAARILLGSVTADVLRSSHIPVLAVKHFGAHLSALEALLKQQFWQGRSPKSN